MPNIKILCIIRCGNHATVQFIRDGVVGSMRLPASWSDAAIMDDLIGGHQDDPGPQGAQGSPGPQTEAEWRTLGKELKIKNYHNLKLETLKIKIAQAVTVSEEFYQ